MASRKSALIAAKNAISKTRETRHLDSCTVVVLSTLGAFGSLVEARKFLLQKTHGFADAQEVKALPCQGGSVAYAPHGFAHLGARLADVLYGCEHTPRSADRS